MIDASGRLSSLPLDASLILPSLLMCDFGHLADEVARVEQAGVQALHLDVMDGAFVPNLSYGLPLVETIRRLTTLPLDVHLMIANPGEHDYLARYRDAGADLLTIHIEAAPEPRPLLDTIHGLGALAGLAINPPTPLERVLPFVEACDLVLVMSVMPGFGGQKFDRRALDKLRTLDERFGSHLRLEVDGGVNNATLAECREAGARWFVVGSAIFGTPDYGASVAHLQSLASAPQQEAPR